MTRIKSGDIFKIETKKGMSFFQCIKIDKLRCVTIKVFNKLYDERPSNIEDVLHVKDYYFINFPLKAAVKRAIVQKTGSIALPDDFKMPTHTRTKHVINGEFLGWHIVEISTLKMELVKTLSPEQKLLSPAGIWNDTLLKEMLEKGWNLDGWN